MFRPNPLCAPPYWEPMPYPSKRTDDSALLIHCNDVGPGWEMWALLLADLHWDSIHCNRALLKRHLEQAKERDASVFLFGDTFDAMQGVGDRRSAKTELRPEFKGNNYTDLLVDGAAEWLRPYAENIALIGEGNHEYGAEIHLETNLARRLADALGAQHFAEWGFVRWQFCRQHGNRTSRTLYWHHGSGGGGAVTKGVILANRRDAYVQEVDFLAAGHIHESWALETPVLRLTAAGKTELRPRIHLQLATYKQEFVASGYHTRNQRPPKPEGGYWIRFFYDSRKAGNVGSTPIRTD